MAARNYSQNCPIARGLDVVGERWTLLILRELVGGARRYSDLRAELPGIAANLLAERLTALQHATAADLVTTRLGPSDALTSPVTETPSTRPATPSRCRPPRPDWPAGAGAPYSEIACADESFRLDAQMYIHTNVKESHEAFPYESSGLGNRCLSRNR